MAEEKLERMMLTSGLDGATAVMYVDGEVLKQFADGDPEGLVAVVVDFITSDQCDDADLGEGVWVWEGAVRETVKEDDSCDLDFHDGKWRRPSVHELAATSVGKGCHPWKLKEGEGKGRLACSFCGMSFDADEQVVFAGQKCALCGRGTLKNSEGG